MAEKEDLKQIRITKKDRIRASEDSEIIKNPEGHAGHKNPTLRLEVGTNYACRK